MQQQRYLLYFMVILLTFSACKKGELVKAQQFSELAIPVLFSDTPPLDLYLNGQLADSTVFGNGFSHINIPLGSPVQITLRKKHEQEALRDTTITANTTATSLMYAYNEALGFNRFMNSSEFIRPPQDSAAFMFYNNYQNFGNGRIDIIFYADRDGSFTAEPNEEIGALRNIPLGKLSERISFPRPANSNAEPDIYFLVVDTDTKRNIDNETVNALYGIPENYFSLSLKDVFPISSYGSAYGAINVAKVDPFPWEMDVDDGSGTGNTVHKLFNLYTTVFFFKY